jgi:predicted nucleic acid-binding protein
MIIVTIVVFDAHVSGPQTITKNGHPVETMDAFMAAAAQPHRLITRNVSDFDAFRMGAVSPRSKC